MAIDSEGTDNVAERVLRVSLGTLSLSMEEVSSLLRAGTLGRRLGPFSPGLVWKAICEGGGEGDGSQMLEMLRGRGERSAVGEYGEEDAEGLGGSVVAQQGPQPDLHHIGRSSPWPSRNCVCSWRVMTTVCVLGALSEGKCMAGRKYPLCSGKGKRKV